MKKNSTKKVFSLSFFIKIAIFLAGIVIGLLIQRPTIVRNAQLTPTITVNPTPTISNNHDSDWYLHSGKSLHAPYDNKGNYILFFPRYCIPNAQNYTTLDCTYNGSKFSITTNAGGRGVDHSYTKITDTITLGDITWDRAYFTNQSNYDALGSYAKTINGVDQLIVVYYDNYSEETRQEVEKIIATFQPQY